ncbi:MAG: thioredoxin family protein [Fimbriimonadaceae bacterium]
MDREVFSSDEFKKQSKYFVFVHIDAEKQPSVAQRFGVNSYPDIRFLKSDGTEIHKVGGYMPLQPFLAEMDKARRAGGL